MMKQLPPPFSRHPAHANRAQGMLEFALILPLLLVLVFGIIEVGRLIFIYSSVAISSREAARYGSAAGDIGGSVAHYQDCNGIRAAAVRVGTFAGVETSDVDISYDRGSSGTDYATCPLNGSGPEQANVLLGDRVYVQVQTEYQPIMPLLNFNSFTIRSSSVRTIVKDVAFGNGSGGGGGGGGPSSLPSVYFYTPGQTVSEGSGTALVYVLMSSPSASNVVVNFALSGTATPGVDFNASPNGSITIPAGNTSAIIQANLIDDGEVENDEQAVFSITSALNATVDNPSQHILTITDPPFISFTEPNHTVNEADGSWTIQLQMSAPLPYVVTVPFSIGGSAVLGGSADYTMDSSPVTFAPGATTASINVQINEDNIDEENEWVVITLEPPNGAMLTTPSVYTLYIDDNDNLPNVRFAWAEQTVAETAGTAIVSLVLVDPVTNLNTTSGRDVTVSFSIDGTATKDVDYTITPSPITIPAGQDHANIIVTIAQDSLNETDENIVLTLDSAPVNANRSTPYVHTLTISSGTVSPPTVHFASGSQLVAESSGQVQVSVQLSNAWSTDVFVSFLITGTATAGSDYTSFPVQLIIPAGSASASFNITINPDALDEPDEKIILIMDEPIGAVKGFPSEHTITITDDDDPPVVFFNSSGQTYAENAGVVTVLANLSSISGKDVLLPFSLHAVSTTATLDQDFTINTPSPLYFPAGQTTAAITMTIIDDIDDEAAGEDAVLKLDTPTNASLGEPSMYIATIADNDAPVCPVLQEINLSNNSFSVVVDHMLPGGIDVRIEEMVIAWAGKNSNTQLTTVEFDGVQIWQGSDNQSTTSIPVEGAWTPPDSARDLNALQSKTLVFSFSNPLDQNGYFSVMVLFDNGCPVSRIKNQN